MATVDVWTKPGIGVEFKSTSMLKYLTDAELTALLKKTKAYQAYPQVSSACTVIREAIYAEMDRRMAVDLKVFERKHVILVRAEC